VTTFSIGSVGCLLAIRSFYVRGQEIHSVTTVVQALKSNTTFCIGARVPFGQIEDIEKRITVDMTFFES
jgi:hypothetical protein